MPWNYNNPYMPSNQFSPTYQMPNVPAPQMQVVRVHGRPGAEAYAIGPNSSALLLDESGTLVWLCTTDGAGYKTVSAYDIAPHQDAPAPDYSGLENRIKKLEAFVDEYTGDTSAVAKDEPKPASNQTNGGYGTLRK